MLCDRAHPITLFSRHSSISKEHSRVQSLGIKFVRRHVRLHILNKRIAFVVLTCVLQLKAHQLQKHFLTSSKNIWIFKKYLKTSSLMKKKTPNWWLRKFLPGDKETLCLMITKPLAWWLRNSCLIITKVSFEDNKTSCLMTAKLLSDDNETSVWWFWNQSADDYQHLCRMLKTVGFWLLVLLDQKVNFRGFWNSGHKLEYEMNEIHSYLLLTDTWTYKSAKKKNRTMSKQQISRLCILKKKKASTS